MNNELLNQKNNKQVAIWLLIGVGMIVIQVLLGGITRLTESGLSITEWKPITGALPPLNDASWQVEFDKYRNTDQFKYVHQYFSLRDFKFIFFWEWFHRLWARFMGMVFIIGFLYFVIKRKFNKGMITPMIVLFFLGALQGAIGWIMVKSGLVPEKYFVGHIELTTHFIAALILLSYTLWFALSLLPAFQQKFYDTQSRNILLLTIALLFVQLMYGGFMAGLKAAQVAPTWPDINGNMMPAGVLNSFYNLFHDPLAIHFIHRGIAYLLTIIIIAFFIVTGKKQRFSLYNKFRVAFLMLLILQVLLGIFTVINATSGNTFIWLGVLHQFSAMLLVMCSVSLFFMTRKVKLVSA